MINNKELSSVKLSATKKDYYQIWNELLDLAGKISERWDPKSTNESDPGIVLLKVLTALGDKLNYNIDANILEAYMPSAAQMESMRKLCEMMGYNIKYYQSAVTTASFAYTGDAVDFADEAGDWQLVIPRFTSITNDDHDVNYITIEDKIISNTLPSQTIRCMEGQIVKCETNNNDIITINQLDTNNRFYLPENQIAENGIFIYRLNDGLRSEGWKKVDNLNIQPYNSLVYKFGFDSKENRPYIQFPDDINQIIEDGLEIYYVRTSGVNGNISPRILSTFEKPSSKEWESVDESDFIITNNNAAVNGSNIETINQAYNNYKKTVGTFETLVTCRDYMNVIYNFTNETNTPLVSNIIVSDIRDDINRAVTLCSFDDYGISYVDEPFKQPHEVRVYDKDYPAEFVRVDVYDDAIDNFDLILYPFKQVYGLNTKDEYKNSFKLATGAEIAHRIESKLADYKTISHNIVYPAADEIVCIKNYLKLDVKITTTAKVNIIEEASILAAVKAAIFKKFNARELDFGEEIPFESILDCIENADTHIKNVALAEPTLYTKFEFGDGSTHDLASYVATAATDGGIDLLYPGRRAYNKMALRNILAGRVELFNYSTLFNYDLTESKYGYTIDQNKQVQTPYSPIYPETENKSLLKLEPSCTFKTRDKIVLGANELIKFRAPNFKTEVTYPAYVNYYLHLNDNTADVPKIPATFLSLRDFLTTKPSSWTSIITHFTAKYYKSLERVVINEDTFKQQQQAYGALFKIEDEQVTLATSYIKDTIYYCLPVNIDTFPLWISWVREQTYNTVHSEDPVSYNGIYRSLGYSLERPVGYMVDANLNKYQLCTKWHTVDEKKALDYYYIQKTNDRTVEPTADSAGVTSDGLGRDAVYAGISKNSEYQLQEGEYLAINYTPAAKEGQTSDPEPINKVYLGGIHWSAEKQKTVGGDIIRPNFELKDSNKVNTLSGLRYAKTSGYTFSDIPRPAGMYSFKANEQVEIRNFVQVELTDEITFLYWTLNNEDAAIAQVESTGKYTLEDGEYVYYTDINKTAMAYYGSGTELTFFNGANFKKQTKAREISAVDIANKGLSIIPWISYSLGKEESSQRIVIREYQYITLTNGDTINKIILTSDSSETGADPLHAYITSNWSGVQLADYTSSTGSNSLPKIMVKDEFDNALTWQVRSKLTLNVAPNSAQILGSADNIKLTFDNDTVVNLAPRYNADKTKIVPLSFKTNYNIQSASDTLSTKIDNSQQEFKADKFTIKVFENNTIGAVHTEHSGTTTDPSTIQLHNFGGKWSTAFFSNMVSRDDYLKLYLNVPDESFGLIMINYSGAQGNISNTGAYIELVDINDGRSWQKPVIYNYYSKTASIATEAPKEAWWDGLTLLDPEHEDHYVYFLKHGINIIKVKAGSILRIHPDAEFVETIIFSDLDIISNENPINLKLLGYQSPIKEHYQAVGSLEEPDATATYLVCPEAQANDANAYVKKTNVKQFESGYKWFKLTTVAMKADQLLLQDININDPAHKFYYNCPLDNTAAIDLNPKLVNTQYEELLSDPQIWFDTNNINNKFVISEIDADYLDQGIQIARTSKR